MEDHDYLKLFQIIADHVKFVVHRRVKYMDGVWWYKCTAPKNVLHGVHIFW